jgi:hypothetical protein
MYSMCCIMYYNPITQNIYCTLNSIYLEILDCLALQLAKPGVLGVCGGVWFFVALPGGRNFSQLRSSRGRALKSTLNFLGRIPFLSLIGIDL